MGLLYVDLLNIGQDEDEDFVGTAGNGTYETFRQKVTEWLPEEFAAQVEEELRDAYVQGLGPEEAAKDVAKWHFPALKNGSHYYKGYKAL